jgi:hypothetical protein
MWKSMHEAVTHLLVWLFVGLLLLLSGPVLVQSSAKTEGCP